MKTNEVYGQTETTFTTDELGAIQTLPTAVLVAVAQGKLDLNLVARHELAGRGRDKQGNWCGFEQAAKIHGTA